MDRGTEARNTNRVEGRDARPARSRLYPWYDSLWLAEYEQAKSIIRAVKPAALMEFEGAFRVLHTRHDFEAVLLDHPFDDETLAEIRKVAATLRPTDLELHETRNFGRFVVHDHPYFAELQRRMVPLVSDVVGEPVDPGYNFLSLYTNAGICPVHMDSPEAKWTLDLCVDQSAPWPIHFSQVCPWPDPEVDSWPKEHWQEAIKTSPALHFTPYVLHPGQAVVFSGSSQWHYRDAMPATGHRSFCTVLFLHYVPRGTKELLNAERWASLFGIPELRQVPAASRCVGTYNQVNIVTV